ncbi:MULTISPECIES: hypothetical protein [unclassified Duganella]|uniref:hypothetical protein n=1 Tax=unclassified Duganella TaxID=2636909 RepID=UPI000E357303|nr:MULTISPECIES: hypothetical protein [unclassified Duganella]RFP15952.1 hypothetical protein D0T23_08595 [Duganella sp. BJB475]RFP32884.1 hypothetical protein D0T21_12035 [Duganella sp. BJB476]
MKPLKSKWIAYTVVVGLIPMLTRLLIWTATTAGRVAPLAASDFVALGLVLHISIVNELEHVPSKEADIKTILNGTSLLFITLYGALHALTVLAEQNATLIDPTSILQDSIALAGASMALSLVVFQYLSRRSKR